MIKGTPKKLIISKMSGPTKRSRSIDTFKGGQSGVVQTAGDDRVCKICAALGDKHGIVPVHPNCRCTVVGKM
jgi:hypothetical protein